MGPEFWPSFGDNDPRSPLSPSAGS